MLTTRNACNTLTLTARSPAKLIISGEHSVLYEQPAIAMAVNRYTSTAISWQDTTHVNFKLLDLNYIEACTVHSLNELAKNLRKKYKNFINGKEMIRNVMQHPFELLQYTVANLLDSLNLDLPSGMEITVNSNVPIGCGMGSSAAAVVSTLHALVNLLQINWQRQEYLAFSKQIENLQHGKSSGLDLHLVTYGGCVRFISGTAQACSVPNFSMYLVNTGKPVSSTGECVAHVATILTDKTLVTEFGAITTSIQQAISNNNLNDFKFGIKQNHRLLQRVGVVPPKVAAFIAAIEQAGGAAKVCGAGAVAGEQAGVVLLVGDNSLTRIVNEYGYNIQTIEVDNYGTRVL